MRERNDAPQSSPAYAKARGVSEWRASTDSTRGSTAAESCAANASAGRKGARDEAGAAASSAAARPKEGGSGAPKRSKLSTASAAHAAMATMQESSKQAERERPKHCGTSACLRARLASRARSLRTGHRGTSGHPRH